MIVTLLIASLAVVLRIIRQAGWKEERGKLAPTMRDASSEPGCSCDQEQPCPEDDDSDVSRGVMPWSHLPGGDGCLDLLALPFPDSHFDVVWTQHVVMNIPDRERIYREFRRMLKPGGKLAFYDVLATEANLELHFPVPWAESSETSFLFTQDKTSSLLAKAGFTITAWNDVTIEALKWIGQQRPPAQGFNLALVMGPRFGEMSANLARNIREGRVRFVMGVCTADSTRS
jgi:SAM-dependent methyltransferase